MLRRRCPDWRTRGLTMAAVAPACRALGGARDWPARHHAARKSHNGGGEDQSARWEVPLRDSRPGNPEAALIARAAKVGSRRDGRIFHAIADRMEREAKQSGS
jgi:hypothetical protein